MAYRRRQGISKSSTFKEEILYPNPPPPDDNNVSSSSSSSSSSSLAAQAIRASSAHRDSSLSSAYRESAFSSTFRDSDRNKSFPVRSSQDSTSYEYTSMKNLNESKYGFWGVLAKKAKSILEDDNVAQQFNKPGREGQRMLDIPSDDAFHQPYQSPESGRKADLQKGLDAITSSLNYIGGTIGKSFEEGLTIVENRTADIIQDARKLHIRKKAGNLDTKPNVFDVSSPHQHIQIQADQEMQLKASRDVAMAMTAKAKLLLRELKTVKADLAFAKERSNQLEEENKILRESRDKGDRPEDDDLIRLQLETLLAEKARLANENSIYARENRFLREIVEYHQLTMQDVVYLDEGIEEVTEVYPITMPVDTGRCLSPPPAVSPGEAKDISMSPRPEPVGIATPTSAKDVSVSSTPQPDSTTTPTAKSTSTSRTPEPVEATSPEAVKDVSVSPTPQIVPVAPINAVISKSSVSGSRPEA